MIHTDGIPTIAFANLRHITEPEIEDEMVEEYIDYLLTENGVHLQVDDRSNCISCSWGKLPCVCEWEDVADTEDNIWDDPWAEYDWLLEQHKPSDLVWDTEPDK